MPDERNRINKRFQELQREIAELRKKLESVNDEKEKWFKRKEELKKNIANFINEAKRIREEKIKFNEQVKELKEKRDKQNSITKEKINKINELKNGINFKEKRKSADAIKEEIARIEEKIETEALKFSEEKKLMKRNVKLRQEYEKARNVGSAFGELKKIEDEIRGSRKIAEELHKKVQELVEESKRKHGVYLEISRKIREINNEQENSFDNFLKFKEEFNRISNGIDNKLGELKNIKDRIDNFKAMDKEKRDEMKKKILVKKADDVEEKLKKGEKLTTEDLIKFQGGRE